MPRARCSRRAVPAEPRRSSTAPAPAVRSAAPPARRSSADVGTAALRGCGVRSAGPPTVISTRSGRASSRSGAARRRGGQQRVRVEARAQRQADLRRVAVGRRRLVRARRPHQPQHRQLTVAAGQLGGRAGQLARRRPRSPRPRTRRRRARSTTRGASDSASTAAKPTPNRPTDPASSRFAEARNAASALDARGVQRRAGVRHTQLAVVHRDPEPARDTRGARGVGGVLRQLDAPRVRVSPEPQVLLGVRVFPEPGGRVGPGGENAGPQRSGTERIAAEVGRHREPAGSSSTPSS